MSVSDTTARKSSLRGLRTFCVAARHLSFRLAAEELHVTASAVSHQIKSLEEELDQALFVRTSRTLELTDAGAGLSAELSPLIDAVDDIAARYRSRAVSRQLRISVQPFFASEMFVPLLSEFTASHPDIEISVDTSDESAEKHPPSADVSIRLFRSAPTDLSHDALFPLRLIPACSPDFLKRFSSEQAKYREPFPIILHASRPTAWQHWCQAAGVKLPEPSRTFKVDSMIAVARAAERGLGAALIPMPLSSNWFKYGALVPLFDREVVLEACFYFVTEKSNDTSPDVQALRAWVLENFQGI